MAVLARSKPKVIKMTSALREYFQTKLAAELGPYDVKHLLEAGYSNVVILDVRSSEAYREGHIPGAVNIPFDELSARYHEISKNKEVISYCSNITCLLCTKAAYFLASNGYESREMVGGFEAWKNSGFTVDKR